LGARGRIFISYRRDDAAGDARGVCERLERAFGKTNVFMDVNKMLAGQRFEHVLDEALSQCDVLIAVIGPRWMELLSDEARGSKRDFLRDEIAAALQRKIVVIPVLIGRKGNMPPLPKPDDLPDDIRDLVQYQKHDIAHESFESDAAQLTKEIKMVLRGGRRQARPWPAIAILSAIGLLLMVAVLGYWMNAIPQVRPGGNSHQSRPGTDGAMVTAQLKLEADRAAAEQSARKEAADQEATRKKADEQARLAGVTDCDRLAASPYDTSRPSRVAGIDLTKIDSSAATPACDDATRRYPDVARFAFQAGRAADAGKDYARAVSFYRVAIEKGSLFAMANLGLLYANGLGVAQDYAEARKWCEKGAELGEPGAMNCLGILYYRGWGVTQNYSEARSWYEKGSALGDATATYNLGLIYERGRGVAIDREQARKLYQKAADAGDEDAKERLKNLK
jgi:TPR repeat protein